MNNYIIRKSQEEDFDSIYMIQSKSIIHPWSYDMCKDDFENENSTYYVVEIDENVVGYAAFQTALDEATLMSLAVDDEYRKNGIGRDLLLYAFNHLKENGITKVMLEVRSTNAIAINLYESLDFKVDTIRKNYYKEPECDAILMSKKI